jgi:hypothetical protein
MRFLRIFAVLSLIAGFLMVQKPTSTTSGPAFNFDTGNAAIEVIVPTIIPQVYQHVSPDASDATLVLRITTVVTNSWFDAVAPYHPTAVGVYSNLGHRPEAEWTDANRNVAILYASYRAMLSLMPAQEPVWRGMLASVGLDPDDDDAVPDTAIGIGNAAGNAVVAAREQDGMNQLGNEGGCQYNCMPYADYTGYEPVNTAYDLVHPGRWQPDIVTTGNGIFRVQQFVTPQLRLTDPYSITKLNKHKVKPPVKSKPQHPGYKQQADEVLAASANLSDEQKMIAELFNDKLRSLGFSALFISQSRGLTLEEFVWLDFVTNIAAFDTAIAVWNQKARYDAVRPFSAISYLYGDDPITAWGGPGQGTVSDMTGNEWRSYLQTADHPEYPSASASFCAAHAQTMRRFFGEDALGWVVEVPQGSSRIEPGITPASDLQLSWPTWTEFEEECGMSRFWAGVHFLSSIEVATDLGRPIGDLAYEFMIAHIEGDMD